jgi:hypothetical protein
MLLIRRTKDGNEGEDEIFSGVTGSRGARSSLDPWRGWNRRVVAEVGGKRPCDGPRVSEVVVCVITGS